MNHEALFSSFSPVTPDAWKQQIFREIKAATDAEKEAVFNQKLHWLTPEGITVPPFFTRENIHHIPAHPLRQQAGWRSRIEIAVREETAANETARESLAPGTDEIFFDLTHKSSVAWRTLLAGLPADQNLVQLLVSGTLLEDLQRSGDAAGQATLGVHWPGGDAPDIALADAVAAAMNASVPPRLVINGHDYHNAGASATQELAFSLAALTDCLDGLTDRGLTAGSILKATELWLSADTGFFLQIAKLRALRLLVGQLAGAYQAQHSNFRLHVRTARWNKFRQDAYNNMLRCTLEGMAAVLGGCDSLTVEPYNSRYGETDTQSRRIARNVHAILREESYLAKVADPAAGTYFLESLTYSLAQEAWKMFQTVEAQGGYRAARRSGFVQEEIAKVRTERENAIRQGKQVLVGINKYQPAEGESVPENLFEPLSDL